MRVWISNFDFEHQLAEGVSYQRTKQLARINAELSAHLIPLAVDHDAIVGNGEFSDTFLKQIADVGFPLVESIPDLQIIPDSACASPWGWSASLIREFKIDRPNNGPPVSNQDARDGKTTPSDLDAVHLVNSRAFSSDYESQYAPLPYAREISSVDELRDAIDGLADSDCGPSRRWVVKANHSMSGRERMCGRKTETGNPTVDEQTSRWVTRRLAMNQRLFFEPWLDRVEEFSVHWDVEPTATPELMGITQLLCDENGRFQGNRVFSVEPVDTHCVNAIEKTRKLARSIQATGYHGAIGIDCMVHRTTDGVQLRVAQDINARWSMGRVALRAAELLGETEATLMHYPTAWLQGLNVGESLDVTVELQAHWPTPIRRALRTTPWHVNGNVAFQTSVLVIE
jgi:hypothetical protein